MDGAGSVKSSQHGECALVSGVLVQGALAGAAGHAQQICVGTFERAQHLPGVAGDEHLLAGLKKRIQSAKPVGNNRRAAGRSFKKSSRRTISGRRHRLPRQIQREARRTVQRRMIGWARRVRSAAHSAATATPRDTADRPAVKARRGTLPCRLQEHRLQLGLAVRRVGTHVAEFAAQLGHGPHRAVDIRVHAAEERARQLDAEIALQRDQRAAARPGEHQIEGGAAGWREGNPDRPRQGAAR